MARKKRARILDIDTALDKGFYHIANLPANPERKGDPECIATAEMPEKSVFAGIQCQRPPQESPNCSFYGLFGTQQGVKRVFSKVRTSEVRSTVTNVGDYKNQEQPGPSILKFHYEKEVREQKTHIQYTRNGTGHISELVLKTCDPEEIEA